MDVTLNNASCLRDVGRIGYTEIHNVCTGSIATVPWGVGSWLLTVFVAIVVSLALVLYVFLEYPGWAWKRRMRAEGKL